MPIYPKASDKYRFVIEQIVIHIVQFVATFFSFHHCDYFSLIRNIRRQTKVTLFHTVVHHHHQGRKCKKTACSIAFAENMYQPATAPHGFNHQSFYHQPVSNLRQVNDVVWNQNNESQLINGFLPSGYSTIPNQQTFSQYENPQNQAYSSLRNTNGINPYFTNTVLNTKDNSTALSLPPTARQSRPTAVAANTSQNRNVPRQSSTGAVPEPKTTTSNQPTPLLNSRSAGAVSDYIQRERRSHTMAPMSRITGPNTSISTTMFASTVAPSDARAANVSHTAQTVSNGALNSYPQSNAERSDITSISGTERIDKTEDEVEEEGDDDEDDDDDDGPIIVKVRYDPDAGGPPSEDVIRQALDNQLKGQSSPKLAKQPLILNFFDTPPQSENKQVPVRQPQPVFNRVNPPVPQQVIHSQQQIPKVPIAAPQRQVRQQNLSSLQQRHQQHQQFLQQQQPQQLQQQEQYQQFLQHQQQQLYQQQLQKQKQQEEQQRLQRQRQEQEQFQRQKQQQKLLLQQQKEKKQMQEYLHQVQLQNQLKLEQQREQQLLLLDQQRIQREIKAEQQEINRLIKEQLRREHQQQEQQRYRQLFQPQQVHQRKQEVYQQPQQQQQQQQYASLPPMGPRPSRTLSAIRTVPINRAPVKSQQNNNIYLPQPFPPAVLPFQNPQPIFRTHPPRIPVRPAQSASNSIASGLGLYASLSHQNLSSTFAPIQTSLPLQQQHALINNNSLPNIPQTVTQRPHTAPSFTEIFRAPSVLDIPELSAANLSSMLDKIPDLHGSRFNIEYAESDESRNIPIPSQQDSVNDRYPEAVIVDQLPNNLIQHVNSSDNLELKAVINATMQDANTIPFNQQSYQRPSVMKEPLSNVVRTKARPKDNVKQSPSVSSEDSSDDAEASSSDDETEFEETVTENVSLPRNIH